jgi:hypothetical protein
MNSDASEHQSIAAEDCEVNLQWKGTDACYDFYCPCGWEGSDDPSDPDLPDSHRDGMFMQEFQCGGCGRWWHLPNLLIARPGKFSRDDGGSSYGCEDCETGHQAVIR